MPENANPGYNNFSQGNRPDWFYLLIFVHIEEGEAAAHLWTMALVPPTFNGDTEFTLIQVSNDSPEVQQRRDWARVEVSRKYMRQPWLEADYYNSIRVCQFPPEMEPEFVGAIVREVLAVPEGGSWPNGLCEWLVDAGWLHTDYEEDFHNALMWDLLDDHEFAMYRDRRDRRMRWLAQARITSEAMRDMPRQWQPQRGPNGEWPTPQQYASSLRGAFSFQEALDFMRQNPDHVLSRLAVQQGNDSRDYAEADGVPHRPGYRGF